MFHVQIKINVQTTPLKVKGNVVVFPVAVEAGEVVPLEAFLNDFRHHRRIEFPFVA